MAIKEHLHEDEDEDKENEENKYRYKVNYDIEAIKKKFLYPFNFYKQKSKRDLGFGE